MFIGTVDVLNITLAQAFHEISGTIGLIRSKQKMNMICHQSIGMNKTACTTSIFLQPLKIEQVIFVSIKTCLPIIFALNNMERNSGYNDSVFPIVPDCSQQDKR